MTLPNLVVKPACGTEIALAVLVDNLLTIKNDQVFILIILELSLSPASELWVQAGATWAGLTVFSA